MQNACKNNKTQLKVRTSLFGRTVLVLLLLAGAAGADDWSFTFTPYMWATNIGVDVKLNGRQVVNKDIPVSDLLKDLNTIFQGRFEAQKGEFGAMVDLFDVTMSDEVQGIQLPQGAGTADLKSDIGMTLLDVAGTYDRKGDRQGLTLVYGARLLNNRATIDAMMNLSRGQSVAQTYETNEWLADGLLGVRFDQRISRHWALQVQGDASTGGTRYTWSIDPSLSYNFGKLERYGITAGYRHMVIDYNEDNGLDSQMTMSGALVNFRASF